MLVCPPAVVHVTRISAPDFVTEVIRNSDALLVGSSPARNWFVLLIPFPSGSAFGWAWTQLVQLKYWDCQVINGSWGGAMLATTRLTWPIVFVETVYVKFVLGVEPIVSPL